MSSAGNRNRRIPNNQNIAMRMEPSETYLLRQTTRTKSTSEAMPTQGYNKVMTEAETATPFPPLNLKNTDQLCPIMTLNPATKNPRSGVLKKKGKAKAAMV